MQIVENKALLLRTRSPQKFGIIPRSRIVGQTHDGAHEVLVYWGLDEVRVLRNLGVEEAPSPILRNYTWPARFKPFEHQKDTAAFLTLNRRAFCFNDPGTGKTLSALWAADYLMLRKQVRRVLILCPLSIMDAAWLSEIHRSVIHRSAIIAHHTQAERRVRMIEGDYEFVIVNYDGLKLVADAVVKDGTFDLVIVDEANAYKNDRTERWKTLNKILKPDTMLWMMTGTPAAQSPEDAFGLAKLVNPTGIPRYFTQWRDLVMNKITTFKWAPKRDAQEKVFAALQPAIRYTKEECLDLPPVLTQVREIPLTLQQVKYYKQIKEMMITRAAGETITAVNAAAGVNKLLQISAGSVYTDNKEVVEFDCAPRLNVLKEVIEDTDRKVIVFIPYRHSMAVLFDALGKYGVEQIHGDISTGQRNSIFKRFQNEDSIRILLIQPQAAAHGVTLTRADTVVFWGPVMSTETYLQCIARTDRIGQDSEHVTVVHLQGSDIERRMYAALEKRVENHNLLIQMYADELGLSSS
jgi:SNF2 family DNA or RNA helicase